MPYPFTSNRLIDLDRLSPIERIALADALYDSAMQEIDAQPFTREQLADLDRRIADVEQGRMPVIAWEQIGFDRSKAGR